MIRWGGQAKGDAETRGGAVPGVLAALERTDVQNGVSGGVVQFLQNAPAIAAKIADHIWSIEELLGFGSKQERAA